MKPIELERWEPAPDDPRRKVYAGQRTAQEVFEELRYRLEGMGYLPDEYLFMDREWANGREIPRGAEIFCITDYGGSEGIYTDISLRWYQDGKSIIESFATGKTLGESGSDLDRMYLIASAIIKAFQGDRGTYARYLRLGEQPEPENMILHLNRRTADLYQRAGGTTGAAGAGHVPDRTAPAPHDREHHRLYGRGWPTAPPPQRL